MNTEPTLSAGSTHRTPDAAAPSADFIHAISEFFDTDPSDLLVELGYYEREGEGASQPALID